MLSRTSLVFLFSSLIRRNRASICSAFFDKRGLKTFLEITFSVLLLDEFFSVVATSFFWDLVDSESVDEMELESPESPALLRSFALPLHRIAF